MTAMSILGIISLLLCPIVSAQASESPSREGDKKMVVPPATARDLDHPFSLIDPYEFMSSVRSGKGRSSDEQDVASHQSRNTRSQDLQSHAFRPVDVK